MKYPKLVSERVCKTPCIVTIYGEGLNEDGQPEALLKEELMCNYQEKASFKSGDKTAGTVVVGSILFPSDFCPSIPVISSGEVEINGMKRRITNGQKHRNLDGSVNYISLEIE